MLWLRRADRPSVTPPGGGVGNAHISKYGHSEAGGGGQGAGPSPCLTAASPLCPSSSLTSTSELHTSTPQIFTLATNKKESRPRPPTPRSPQIPTDPPRLPLLKPASLGQLQLVHVDTLEPISSQTSTKGTFTLELRRLIIILNLSFFHCTFINVPRRWQIARLHKSKHTDQKFRSRSGLN